MLTDSVFVATHASCVRLRARIPIMQELAREGIVKKVPEVHIRDLVGQYSHLGSAQRRDPKRAGIGADPSMADIRRVATLYVMMLLLVECCVADLMKTSLGSYLSVRLIFKQKVRVGVYKGR